MRWKLWAIRGVGAGCIVAERLSLMACSLLEFTGKGGEPHPSNPHVLVKAPGPDDIDSVSGPIRYEPETGYRWTTPPEPDAYNPPESVHRKPRYVERWKDPGDMRVTWIPHGEPGHSCGPYCPGRLFGTGQPGTVPGSPSPAAAVSLPPPPPVNGPPPGAPTIIAAEPAPPSPSQPDVGITDLLRTTVDVLNKAKELKGSAPSSHSSKLKWPFNQFHKSKTPPLDSSKTISPKKASSPSSTGATRVCPKCGGTGKQHVYDSIGRDRGLWNCSVCGGSGRVK